MTFIKQYSDETPEHVQELARRMMSHFLTPVDVDSAIENIKKEALRLPACLRQPSEAFNDAISATLASTSLPYQLTSSRTFAFHFHRFHMAERIRALKTIRHGEIVTKEKQEGNDNFAYETARKHMMEFQDSDEGRSTLLCDISVVLLDALEDLPTANASKELLYQAVVSIWSAFEVFSRDLLTQILNEYPHFSEKILTDTNAKKLFELPKISIDDLSTAGFDLSGRMGNVLFGTRDFSDIRTIKAALSAICEDSNIKQSLSSDVLWNLNQDRHLIVHRRGIVDNKYHSTSPQRANEGCRIAVTPNDIESYISAVMGAAIAILDCMSVSISNSQPSLDKS